MVRIIARTYWRVWGSLGYTLYALFASFLFNWISLAISRSTTHANELSFLLNVFG